MKETLETIKSIMDSLDRRNLLTSEIEHAYGRARYLIDHFSTLSINNLYDAATHLEVSCDDTRAIVAGFNYILAVADTGGWWSSRPQNYFSEVERAHKLWQELSGEEIEIKYVKFNNTPMYSTLVYNLLNKEEGELF